MEKFYITRDKKCSDNYGYNDNYVLWMGKPKKGSSGIFNDTEDTVLIHIWKYSQFPYKNINIKPGECLEVKISDLSIVSVKKVKKVKNSIKIGDHFYLKGKLFFVSEFNENGIIAKMDPVPDPNEKCHCGNGKKYKNCCGKKI